MRKGELANTPMLAAVLRALRSDVRGEVAQAFKKSGASFTRLCGQ